MAKSLQCPSCGAKRRVDTLPDADTYVCERCAAEVKVPAGLGRPHPAEQDVGAGVVAPPGAPPPPPRRRTPRPVASNPDLFTSDGQELAPPPRNVVLTAAPAPAVDVVAVGWPTRLLCWVVAVPTGLALVGLPARHFGYLSSQRLLDVVIEHDVGRFVPLLVVVALWALATALIVHVLLEWLRRHRIRALEHSSLASVSSWPGISPPPRRSARRSAKAARRERAGAGGS